MDSTTFKHAAISAIPVVLPEAIKKTEFFAAPRYETTIFNEADMGKNNYIGGSTKVWINPNGTAWETTDYAEHKQSKKRATKTRDKLIPQTQNRATAAIEKHERVIEKLIRSFISQCATAYSKGKLTSAYPSAPKSLAKGIKLSGGNISWLTADDEYKKAFHRYYCRCMNKNISYEKVWLPKKGQTDI